jgi:perosamine synthetase
VQLRKLDGFVEERARWAAFYQRELEALEWLSTPRVPAGDRHGWQAYVCSVDERRAPRTRDEIMGVLQERGISTRPGTHALHLLGYYRRRLALGPDDFPGARDAHRYSLALPLHNRMVPDDYAYVVDAMRSL